MRFAPIKEEIEKPTGFDLTVQHRDPKTGLIIREDPYIMRTMGAPDGGKSRVWERPAGSGNLWDKQGNPIGRWDKTKPEGQRFLKDEPHIQWTAPETDDQKLARSLGEKDIRITELEKEIASIKMESNRKGEAQGTPKKHQGA